MSFDAGAVVGRMVMDRSGWDDGVRKVQSDIQQFGQRVTSLGQSFTSVGRNLGMLSRNLIFFGAGILTPLVATFKSVSNYSYSVSIEIRRLNDSFKNFRVEIAEAMIPAVKQFNAVFSQFVKWFKDLPDNIKQSYINTALMTGAILVLAGTVGVAIANLVKLFGASFKLIGMAMTASLTNPITWIVAGIGGIIYMMWKWQDVATVVCNTIELLFMGLNNSVSFIKVGWIKMAIAIWDVFEKIGQYILAHPFMAKLLGINTEGIKIGIEVASGIKDMLQRDLTAPLNELNKKIAETNELIQKMARGEKGNLATGFEDAKNKIQEYVKTIGDLWGQLKAGTVDYVDTSKNLLDEFFNGLRKGWDDVIADMKNMFNFGVQIAKGFINNLTSFFNDFFYNILTGQINDINQVFADFGKSILRIISQIISQFVVLGLLTGNWNWGGFLAGMFPSHQTGIDYVPHTGVYKLEEGEKVVPRYDATKKDREPMQIMNFITPEAVAMAMADKAGQNVIINIINTDSLRNGMTRREIYRR